MKNFITNFCLVLGVVSPIYAQHTNNYTCGAQGICSESTFIELQHQGTFSNVKINYISLKSK